MPTEFAGVLAVPLIMGLVEMAKRFGLETVWAAPMAVLLGVLLAVGWEMGTVYAEAQRWIQAVLWGVALGLSAAGLYSGGKKVVEG